MRSCGDCVTEIEKSRYFDMTDRRRFSCADSMQAAEHSTPISVCANFFAREYGQCSTELD
jgi:hypothetical protein